MKDVRVGDYLWDQWQGEGYEEKLGNNLIYYTQEHVDLDNELVRRGLASALQRDGMADSLWDGFKLTDSAETEWGWAGVLDGDLDMTVCSESGETPYGDFVEESVPITWVEFLFS